MNARVPGKGLKLHASGGRFEINLLLFSNDAALVAFLEEKLCRLAGEFGKVCSNRKLRVNLGVRSCKSKVRRC